MTKKFDWKEFFRIALGVFFVGLGITAIGNSAGNFVPMVLGFVFISIGVAVIVSK